MNLNGRVYMKIMDIYRLSQDFDDYFLLSEDNTYYPKLLKVSMNEKVLDGHKYDNLYALEPTEHYFLTVDGDVTYFDKQCLQKIGRCLLLAYHFRFVRFCTTPTIFETFCCMV